MQQTQTTPALRHLNPLLERIFPATHTPYRRHIVDDLVPLSVKSALPGLEVCNSTREAWETSDEKLRS